MTFNIVVGFRFLQLSGRVLGFPRCNLWNIVRLCPITSLTFSFSGNRLVSGRQGEDVPGGVMSQSSYISLPFPPSLSQVNSSYLSLAAEVHRTGTPLPD